MRLRAAVVGFSIAALVTLAACGPPPPPGQVGFWSGQWAENMGPDFFLTEGALTNGAYPVTGAYGAGSERCTISGSTEVGNYWHLTAGYFCADGSQGHFSVYLSQTRPYDTWAGPWQQDYPTVVKHGTMTGTRVN